MPSAASMRTTSPSSMFSLSVIFRSSSSRPALGDGVGALGGDERRPASSASSLKCSLPATKSVSHFSSTMAPTLPSTTEGDDALGVLAVVALGAGGQALLAQPLLGGLDVAVVGLEGLLGVHHPGAGGLAQGLDVLGGERHGDHALLVSVRTRRRVIGGDGRGRRSAATGSARRRRARRRRLGASRRRRRRRSSASAAAASSAGASTASASAGAAAVAGGEAGLALGLGRGGLAAGLGLLRRRTRPPPRRVRSTAGARPAGCARLAMKRPSSTASAMTRHIRRAGADGVVVAGDRRTG